MKGVLYQVVFLAAVLGGIFLGLSFNIDNQQMMTGVFDTLNASLQDQPEGFLFILFMIGWVLFLCDFVIAVVTGWVCTLVWISAYIGGILIGTGNLFSGAIILIVSEVIAATLPY